MKLKYLFTALLNDGSSIVQTQDDVSSIDPTKSAWYDVLQRLDDVRTFTLTDDCGNYVVVKLVTGQIDNNGIMTKHDEFRPGKKRELIYFRRNRRTFAVANNQLGEELNHHIEFFLGWKVDGKEVIISVS